MAVLALLGCTYAKVTSLGQTVDLMAGLRSSEGFYPVKENVDLSPAGKQFVEWCSRIRYYSNAACYGGAQYYDNCPDADKDNCYMKADNYAGCLNRGNSGC